MDTNRLFGRPWKPFNYGQKEKAAARRERKEEIIDADNQKREEEAAEMERERGGDPED